MGHREHRNNRPIAVVLALVFLSAVPFAGPADAQATETTPAVVTDEAEWRAALTTLSGDTSSDHTIVLGENIKLVGASDPTYTGSKNLTIEGEGFEISGQDNSRILRSDHGDATITFRNIELTDGFTTQRGGAVRGGQTVRIESSVLRDNRVQSTTGFVEGGAVYGSFDVEVEDSVLVRNHVVTTTGNAEGGAIVAGFGNGGVTVTDSTISGNSATSSGGGSSASGGAIRGNFDVDIINSTIADNALLAETSATGGALTTTHDLTVTNSVIASNQATAASVSTAGVNTAGEVTITGSSLTGNRISSTTSASGAAVHGGSGIFLTNTTVGGPMGTPASSVVYAPGEDVNLLHATVAPDTTVAGVTINADTLNAEASIVVGAGSTACSVSSATTSSGFNLDTDDSCGFNEAADLPDVSNPLLGVTRDNGDPVATIGNGGNGVNRPSVFPLNGSLLVDAIPAAQCSTDPGLDADQRGVARPFGPGCDIGAIEAVFPVHDRNDVSAFYEATVRWVTSPVNTPKILSGYPNGSFGQALNITRGQAARLYYNGAGAPDVSGLPAHGFTDSTPFFENAIRWAKAEGLFLGYPDNTFRPNNPIIRGDYTRSLYNFAGIQDVTGLAAHPFTDVTPFYEDAVKWAKARGLANGYPDNTYRQNNNINRGDAARTFYNTAQTPVAWNNFAGAPFNMLWQPNLGP